MTLTHDRNYLDTRISGLVGGPVAPATSRQLWKATHGDPVLLDALVHAALGLNVLTARGGLWQWDEFPAQAPDRLTVVIESRAAEMDDIRLDALEQLTRSLTKPHAAVTRFLRHRHADLAAAHLTRREYDVLSLLCDGLTAQAIAHRLGLSPRTVTKHLERLYRKLGTSDRLTTVLRAQRLGIVGLCHAPATPIDRPRPA